MSIYGAHIHTQTPEGQVEGRAVHFQESFVKFLLKFINKKKKWDALNLFINQIVMLIHFDCHTGIAKQNEWWGSDVPTEA